MIKFIKEQKKSQLKFYEMDGTIYNKKCIAYKRYIKNTPIQWYLQLIKILQRQRSRKTIVKELGKMEKEKIVLRKVPPVLYL